MDIAKPIAQPYQNRKRASTTQIWLLYSKRATIELHPLEPQHHQLRICPCQIFGGAIAGIVIGIVAGLALVTAFAALTTLRGKQQSQTVYHSCKPRIPKGPAPPAELNAKLNGVPRRKSWGLWLILLRKRASKLATGCHITFLSSLVLL